MLLLGNSSWHLRVVCVRWLGYSLDGSHPSPRLAPSHTPSASEQSLVSARIDNVLPTRRAPYCVARAGIIQIQLSSNTLRLRHLHLTVTC